MIAMVLIETLNVDPSSGSIRRGAGRRFAFGQRSLAVSRRKIYYAAMNPVALCLTLVLVFALSPPPGDTLPEQGGMAFHQDMPMHRAAMSESADCPCGKYCMVDCVHAGCTQPGPAGSMTALTDIRNDLERPAHTNLVAQPTHPPLYRPPIDNFSV